MHKIKLFQNSHSCKPWIIMRWKRYQWNDDAETHVLKHYKLRNISQKRVGKKRRKNKKHSNLKNIDPKTATKKKFDFFFFLIRPDKTMVNE